MMAESVRAGIHSDNWRERVPDYCRSCNVETGCQKVQWHINKQYKVMTLVTVST